LISPAESLNGFELKKSLPSDTLKKAFGEYGTLQCVRLMYNFVTGTSKGYAFVTYERTMAAEDAYRRANGIYLDGRRILVDYERSRLMKGWVPRRLGGGFSGKKESGQLRFGARDRPFRDPM
jgi:U11/U12 small nuclear ribonucleoprotein SNRNP35